jgi:hypothetical protein
MQAKGSRTLGILPRPRPNSSNMFCASFWRLHLGRLATLGGRNPAGRGGGRASAALPLLDDVITSPASRRLADARPRSTAGATVLAPKKMRTYFCANPKFPTNPRGSVFPDCFTSSQFAKSPRKPWAPRAPAEPPAGLGGDKPSAGAPYYLRRRSAGIWL